jgi:hypothetical protein
MIKAAIDESKGEFKGTPSAEIRAYDPKNAEEPAGRSEKVSFVCFIYFIKIRTIN